MAANNDAVRRDARAVDPVVDPVRIALLVAGADGFVAEESAVLAEFVGLGVSESFTASEQEAVAGLGAFLARQPALASELDLPVRILDLAAAVDAETGSDFEPSLQRQIEQLAKLVVDVDQRRSPDEQRLLDRLKAR